MLQDIVRTAADQLNSRKKYVSSWFYARRTTQTAKELQCEILRKAYDIAEELALCGTACLVIVDGKIEFAHLTKDDLK